MKICGLRTAEAVAATVDAGAAFLGFVFVAASPRFIAPAEAAELAAAVPPGRCRVGLFVDPDDDDIDATLAAAPIDMVQLHGAEPPERVAEVRMRFGRPVMKAVPIGSSDDVAAARAYDPVSDMLLLDARPPKGAVLTGGGGEAFDWTLLSGVRWKAPWMLAGGLTPDNLERASKATDAPAFDVSSGVEAVRGVKDVDKIAAFVAAARRALAA